MTQDTRRDVHTEWGILVGTVKSIQSELNMKYSTPMNKLGRVRRLVERGIVQEILENV